MPIVGVLLDRGVAVQAAAMPHLGLQARERGWSLVTASRDAAGVAWLQRAGVVGVIGWLGDARVQAALRRWGVAAVDLGPGADGIPGIMMDEVAVGRLAAEHLRTLGLQRLAWVHWGHATRLWADRRRGFLDAAPTASEHRWRGPSAFVRWLARQPRRLGLAAANDELASRLALAATGASWRIPADAALIGVDDDELRCSTCDPPLSSIALDHAGQAARAAALLQARLAGRNPVPGPPIAPRGVVQRASTWRDDDAALAAVIAHLRDPLAADTRLAELARRFGMGARTLQRAVRAATGATPRGLREQARIVRVQEMLRNGAGIIDAARAVGYASTQHLSQVFRRVTGTTPGMWRRRCRVRPAGVGDE